MVLPFNLTQTHNLAMISAPFLVKFSIDLIGSSLAVYSLQSDYGPSANIPHFSLSLRNYLQQNSRLVTFFL